VTVARKVVSFSLGWKDNGKVFAFGGSPDKADFTDFYFLDLIVGMV
jgi:hypothetical protein